MNLKPNTLEFLKKFAIAWIAIVVILAALVAAIMLIGPVLTIIFLLISIAALMVTAIWISPS